MKNLNEEYLCYCFSPYFVYEYSFILYFAPSYLKIQLFEFLIFLSTALKTIYLCHENTFTQLTCFYLIELTP